MVSTVGAHGRESPHVGHQRRSSHQVVHLDAADVGGERTVQGARHLEVLGPPNPGHPDRRRHVGTGSGVGPLSARAGDVRPRRRSADAAGSPRSGVATDDRATEPDRRDGAGRCDRRLPRGLHRAPGQPEHTSTVHRCRPPKRAALHRHRQGPAGVPAERAARSDPVRADADQANRPHDHLTSSVSARSWNASEARATPRIATSPRSAWCRWRPQSATPAA